MPAITERSDLLHVAAIVSNALHDEQSRDQAILVAAAQEIDWDALKTWFVNEGETEQEFQRFKISIVDKRRRR